MRKLIIVLTTIVILLQFSTSWSKVNYAERKDVSIFINQLVHNDGFKKQDLVNLFNSVQTQDRVISSVKQPYEKKPWYLYRNFFMKTDRIAKGVAFWRKHQKTLERAEKDFGVPAEIIVAILGIETKYGERTGEYRVIDTLSTLAFDYPQRSIFFRKELREFLLLSKDYHFDATQQKGSYAGAIGLPQFIPSSIRNYAIDYSHNGKIDLINDPEDVIGSIANYLKKNGWQRNGALVYPAKIKGEKYKQYLKYKPLIRAESFKPRHTLKTLMKKYQISCANDKVPLQHTAVMFSLTQPDKTEYWLGFQNFYVITRYNISKHYAMMVNALANEIAQLHQKEMTTETT